MGPVFGWCNSTLVQLSQWHTVGLLALGGNACICNVPRPPLSPRSQLPSRGGAEEGDPPAADHRAQKCQQQNRKCHRGQSTPWRARLVPPIRLVTRTPTAHIGTPLSYADLYMLKIWPHVLTTANKIIPVLVDTCF